MKFTTLFVLLAGGLLAFTNPDESQYRAHIQERQGILGAVGLGLADLLAKDSSKGIHRENYIVLSRFYAGGDGILPREDLAWGIAGKFIDIERQKQK